MTFEGPSWVHPLPFPFPELHNNFWIEIIALLLEFCMNAKLDLWQQIYLFLKTGEKYMNNFEKIFLLIFKNISRFRNDQLTFNCSQKQKTKNRWRQKNISSSNQDLSGTFYQDGNGQRRKDSGWDYWILKLAAFLTDFFVLLKFDDHTRFGWWVINTPTLFSQSPN